VPEPVKNPSHKPDSISQRKESEVENKMESRNIVYIDPKTLPVIPAQKLNKALYKMVYKNANDSIVHNRGVSGFAGSLVKKFYNFCLHNRMHFVIRGMDKMANKLIKIGFDLKNIDS